MIKYAEYNALVDILKKADTSEVYSELIKKEEKVLDTINSVVKYYKDNTIKKDEFINKPLLEIVMGLPTAWLDIYNDLVNGKVNMNTFKKGDRMIYIGITVVILSIILMFIETK